MYTRSYGYRWEHRFSLRVTTLGILSLISDLSVAGSFYYLDSNLIIVIKYHSHHHLPLFPSSVLFFNPEQWLVPKVCVYSLIYSVSPRGKPCLSYLYLSLDVRVTHGTSRECFFSEGTNTCLRGCETHTHTSTAKSEELKSYRVFLNV